MPTHKKKILFIDGPLGGGGAERVLCDILQNIDYDRYEVDLAVVCRGGILMNEVPNRVNIIELWKGYPWDYKLAFRLSIWFHCNWLFSKKMNGPKLKRDYDIEISFLEGMPLKLGALRTTQSKKATWVHADLFTHRYEISQFYPGEEERDYNKMDYVINVSKDSEKAFKKRFPNCKSNLQVIYNPIDKQKILALADEYTIKLSEDDCLTVITVGRLTRPKNPQRMLEVAKLSKEKGLPVRFKWVGDGELREQMLRLRDEMGLSDSVEFTGYVKNPYPYIKAADIMMVTSDFEGFCLVICEAMCLKVPVISTRTAGPSEIIGDNKYGILTDFTAEAMFSVLEKWTKEPQLCSRYANIAFSRPNSYGVKNTVNSIYSML